MIDTIGSYLYDDVLLSVKASILKEKRSGLFNKGVHCGFWKSKRFVGDINDSNYEVFENGMFVGLGFGVLGYIKFLIKGSI